MRYINKISNNHTKLNKLQRAHQSRQPTTPDEARRYWDNLQDKKDILDVLCSEQYGLCCYSEIRSDELGWGYHIEHIENKSQNPARTFDYTNLVASAWKSEALPLSSNIFGGHAPQKRKTVDMNLFISPLQQSCADFFVYTSDGRIAPHADLNVNDKKKAEYTIDILNLNSSELVTRREKRWQELDDLLKQHDSNDKDIQYWLEIEFLPRAGKLESFFSLKRQFFGGIEKSILQNYNNGELL